MKKTIYGLLIVFIACFMVSMTHYYNKYSSLAVELENGVEIGNYKKDKGIGKIFIPKPVTLEGYGLKIDNRVYGFSELTLGKISKIGFERISTPNNENVKGFQKSFRSCDVGLTYDKDSLVLKSIHILSSDLEQSFADFFIVNDGESLDFKCSLEESVSFFGSKVLSKNKTFDLDL